MPLNRNEFLESVVRDSSILKTIFLNHSGAPATLLTDLSTIDLLADKKITESFKKYCLLHPLVDGIIFIPEFRRARIIVSMHDGSQLSFKLIRNMIKQSLECLPETKIVNEALINDYGMLVPSSFHHYEYMLLKSQFGNKAFPDKYQKYFSALDSKSRAQIFAYIQVRYNMIFNTLEDLYTPTGKTQLKLTIGLRKLGRNSLHKMFIRSVAHLIWNTARLFWKKESHIFAQNSPKTNNPVKAIKRNRAGQAIL